MTESIALLIGIFVGAWLMHRKQNQRSPLPFTFPSDRLDVFDDTDEDEPSPQRERRL